MHAPLLAIPEPLTFETRLRRVHVPHHERARLERIAALAPTRPADEREALTLFAEIGVEAARVFDDAKRPGPRLKITPAPE